MTNKEMTQTSGLENFDEEAWTDFEDISDYQPEPEFEMDSY